ncbi:MAG: histidinol phosphatase [Bacteroidetes bacterium]|nr:histidinol phosphatase [Bacteroidota bacterium]
MFGLFRKKNSVKDWRGGFSNLSTDMHSHLLPGIDDGSPDLETSLFLIKGLMELGYTKLITTPHIYPDVYPNTRDTILKAYDLLIQEIEKEKLPVIVHPAAEYFIDEMFSERIKNKEPFLTIEGNKVLVEISFVGPPSDLSYVLFDMVTGGYQPVLAHPERYAYYHNQPEIYHTFKDKGCLLQVNMLSLLGYYGKEIRETALYLVKNGLVDLVGTDLHHARHLSALQTTESVNEIQSILKDCQLINSSL